MKISFNLGFVEVESHTISKNSICDNIFWPHNVLSPKFIELQQIHIGKNVMCL